MGQVHHMKDEAPKQSQEPGTQEPIKLDKGDYYELTTHIERVQKLSNQMQTLETQAMMLNNLINAASEKRDDVLQRLQIPKQYWNKVSLNDKNLELTFGS